MNFLFFVTNPSSPQPPALLSDNYLLVPVTAERTAARIPLPLAKQSKKKIGVSNQRRRWVPAFIDHSFVLPLTSL